MSARLSGGPGSAAFHDALQQRLTDRGVSRRSFLKFCAFMATTLALPAVEGPRIARALGLTDLGVGDIKALGIDGLPVMLPLTPGAARPPLVWLNFQGCTGDTESFLHAFNPSVSQILLETLSVNYHETLMVPSGELATKGLTDTVAQFPGQYLVVVEGSVPTGINSPYCAIGGRSAEQIITEVCSHAAAVISAGSCSSWGGLPAAAPNPTNAASVKDILPGLANHLSLPGCPMNVVNLTAVIVNYLTYGQLPERDSLDRPLFAYGHLIHDTCPRRKFFDKNQFVEAWGDAGHLAGYCLYKMGCKGPETKANCAIVQWNEATNWPIGAGHGCVGCAAVDFWDRQTPFYENRPLPG